LHVEEPEAYLTIIDEGILVIGYSSEVLKGFSVHLDLSDQVFLWKTINGEFLRENITEVVDFLLLYFNALLGLFLDVDNLRLTFFSSAFTFFFNIDDLWLTFNVLDLRLTWKINDLSLRLGNGSLKKLVYITC